jgi:hypothetical protein
MQIVRDDWCAHAMAAPDETALRKTMQDGVKVFQAARDKDGYATFAKAVQKRGAELKQQGAAHA